MKDLCKNNDYDKTQAVLSLLGNAYILIPRSIFMYLYSNKAKERELARLYLSLVVRCNFDDGIVVLNKRIYNCRRGEYIGTYSLLGQYTRMSYGTIRRLLGILVREGLIKITRLPVGVSIYLYGYNEYTCPGNRNKREELPATPYQTMMAYEEKIRKGIRC